MTTLPPWSWRADRPLMEPETGRCPSCGTLCFTGPAPRPCAACEHEQDQPRHEQDRLFNPPATLRGQTSIGGIE